MRIHETKSALTVFYYLMAIDGAVGEDELGRFYEVGEELDRKSFASYREELVVECQKRIDSALGDDDYYDIIQEGVDAALLREAKDDDRGLTPRLLLWNLFAVAYSNNEYNAAEKKLIAHITRVSGVEKSVLLEMEQMMQTAMSVQCEMIWLQQSNKSYSEVRPLIDELENRIRVISAAAQALIEDEVVLDEPYEAQTGFIDKAKDAIDDAVSPAIQAVGDVAKDVGDKAKNVGGAVAGAVSGAWTGLLEKMQKNKQSTDDKGDR